MCFTPAWSISTAILEFIFATSMLIFFRKSILAKYFAILVYLLGIYQFTEFMICTSENSVLWATAGFIAYTFLPAVGLHAACVYMGKKVRTALIYVLPVLFSALALATQNFISEARCEKYFIILKTYFSQPIASLIYGAYYAGFIIATCILLFQAIRHTRNKMKKEIYFSELAGVILMTVPTYLFIVLFPALNIMFSSILCRFAIFVATAVFIGAYLDNKIRR